MKKDYYAVLGLDRDAPSDQIRKAYRKKALELHPDRNGGSRHAEEAFKELTEAYAVLGDPSRRAAYDARPGSQRGQMPEDLFADLFGHPTLGALFEQLSKEFHRQGLRFDQAYLHRVVQGHRGGIFFGGFVFFGPGTRGVASRRRAAPDPLGKTPEPARLSRKPGLLGRLLGAALPGHSSAQKIPGDVHYGLPVSTETLSRGGPVRIAVPGPSGTETYEVRIPAGATPGTRLRLAGRGVGADLDVRGDLYLELHAAN